MMHADAAPILEIRDLSKSFADQRVLSDICLAVPRGSIVALLGGSGSGKTTLLQLIAGLQDPDAGSITIDGRDMERVPPYERPVNMMFQSYALFPHLSVADNVAYGLKARGTAKPERERLVGWALELVRLSGLGARRPDQLSGGQRQRAALARCLVMRPAILLLDEPMAALDRSLRVDVQRELVAIQRKVGATFVMVTHDQDEAMAMSDYVAVMDRGRIVQFGAPREVYEAPATRFVASFLGTINVFEGSSSADADGRQRLVTADGLSVVHGLAQGIVPGGALGVRPEKLVVAAHHTGLANDYSGTVTALSYCGNLSQLTIRLSGERHIEATLVNRTHAGDRPCGVGDAVHAGFAAEAVVALAP